MPVTIRLRRVGRKKQPSYRVVVTDSTRPRDGQYLETVGFYNPRQSPAELRLDLDKVDAWMSQGAELSETVRSLVRKARKGGDAKVGLMTAAPAEPPAPKAEAPTPAPKAAAAPAPAAAPEPAAPEPAADEAEPAAEPEAEPDEAKSE